MIVIDYKKDDRSSVIRIRLQTEVDKHLLAEAFLRLANGNLSTTDLFAHEGIACHGLKALVLGSVSKMRLERVSVSDNEVSWTKTKEGWLEVRDLVGGLTRASHQVLGEGDAVIEVEF